MKSYSQNFEDQFITDYFKGFTGTLLSIGENDGETFSNAKALIDLGWDAFLVEPSSAFYKMKQLHMWNKKVHCYHMALADYNGVANFYESGAHVRGGSDEALVSTLDFEETRRWRDSGVQFEQTQVPVVSFKNFWALCNYRKFDFISIDAEGADLAILKQIDLSDCKCLVVEWNGNVELKAEYEKLCTGMKMALFNRENIIFTR